MILVYKGNTIFYILQVNIAFTNDMTSHQASLLNLFVGSGGQSGIAPFMWVAIALAALGILLLLVPGLRRNKNILLMAAIMIVLACWLDKGLASSLGEFMPNSFGQITDYAVPINEIAVICGVYAIGLLVVSVLYKVVFAVVKAPCADSSECIGEQRKDV